MRHSGRDHHRLVGCVADALRSGVGVTFGPLLLGACSDVVGLGWATAILPAFLTAGLLTVLRPLPATRSLAA